MKFPDLTKNFRKTFKSVIKNGKKNKRLKKGNHFCQYYHVNKTGGQNMYHILEGNDLQFSSDEKITNFF